MGVKVNATKTGLLCISDSRTYEAAAFIKDINGVESGVRMKVLGVHFTNRPNMSAQVEDICRKF